MVEAWATMGDAAFPAGLDGTSFDAVGGYLFSGFQTNGWVQTEWLAIPGPKLPIWVAGFAGQPEASECVKQLRLLGAKNCHVALDMEARVDKTYVAAFGAVLAHEGYKTLVYGSTSTVFRNPQLNGYWAADYAGIGPFMYNHPGVRMTQWTAGAKFDQSTVKPWILDEFWV